jgi:hypothetical protein
VQPDTRHQSQRASDQAIGLVALTVGCVALSAYMGRDLTGGAALALSVDAVTCRVGLNSAAPEGRPFTPHRGGPTTTTGAITT